MLRVRVRRPSGWYKIARLYWKKTNLKSRLNIRKVWNFSKVSHSFKYLTVRKLPMGVVHTKFTPLKRDNVLQTHFDQAWYKQGPYHHQYFRRLLVRTVFNVGRKPFKQKQFHFSQVSMRRYRLFRRKRRKNWKFLKLKSSFKKIRRKRRLRYRGNNNNVNGWHWLTHEVTAHVLPSLRGTRRHFKTYKLVPRRSPHIQRHAFKLHKHNYLLSHLPLRSVILQVTKAPKTRHKLTIYPKKIETLEEVLRRRKYNRSKKFLLPYLRRFASYYVRMMGIWHKYLKLHLPARQSKFYRMAYYKRSYLLSNVFLQINLYYTLLKSTFFDLFKFKKRGALFRDFSDMRFWFTFKTKRFYINLSTYDGDSCLSISPGMFLKFLNRRKSYKKNRVLCLVMAQYIRKVILLMRLKRFDVVIRRSPYMLNEIFSGMFRPLVHSFKDPVTGRVIDENDKKRRKFRFRLRFLIFEHNKPYGYMKQKLKGRLKRKVWRKIIRQNKIVD